MSSRRFVYPLHGLPQASSCSLKLLISETRYCIGSCVADEAYIGECLSQPLSLEVS